MKHPAPKPPVPATSSREGDPDRDGGRLKRALPGALAAAGAAVAVAPAVRAVGAWGRDEPDLAAAALWAVFVAIFLAAAVRRLRRDLSAG